VHRLVGNYDVLMLFHMLACRTVKDHKLKQTKVDAKIMVLVT